MILDLNKVFNNNSPFTVFPGFTGGLDGSVSAMAKSAILILLLVLAVVWIAMVLYIGIKFITSMGGDAFAEAITSLKNLLVGVTLAFIFLVILYFLAGIFWI